ncbi:MAG: hypothetical protein KDI06_22785, partial [Calditrichaeota bacterium]|nr:hypothetical protein [Calditrichota bacterium]
MKISRQLLSPLILRWWIFLTLTGLAQTGIDTLGLPPNGTTSHAFGVSPDGNAIAGSSQVPGIGSVPLKWTPGGGLVVLPAPPGGNGAGGASDAAAGGAYFSGYAINAQSQTVACRWDSAGAVVQLGFLAGGSSSLANAISDDGLTLAGTAASDSGSSGFYWTANSGMVNIGDLPGGSYYTALEGLSGDGNVAVGWSRAGPDNFGHAFSWTPAGGMVDLGTLPGYSSSVARGASYDGSVIVGSSTRNDSTGQTIQAWRWTAATGMQGLGWMPGGHASRSYLVSGDGTVIVGNTDASPSGWFVWRENQGMVDFLDFMQNEHGIDFSAWRNIFPWDISEDGKTFVGQAIDARNRTMGWRVRLAPITISMPTTGERWVANRNETVRWRSRGVQLFNIDLSTDDGRSWENIDFTTSPGDSMIRYTVPDSLRTSDQCRIRVSNLADSSVFSVSDKFTIKGYDLTRVLPDNRLQAYDPGLHSWSYLNRGDIMWPQNWWQQFDYISGTDPNTGETYPEKFTEPPVNALPWQMPDWPLFVEAFSVDQCYWSTFFSSYKGAAIEYWRTKKKNFFGSCYGFAVSSLLAFDHPAAFLNRNPGIPQADSVNALFLTDTIRKGINREWAKQYAREVLANDFAGMLKSPRDLLREVKQLFLDETLSGRALSFYNNGGSGAHTVLPYRLEHDQNQANLWRLFVYDSNNPNQLNRFILIDSTANTWTDMTGSGWGSGSRGCYLEPSSDLFLQTLHFEDNTAAESIPMLQIYTETTHEILIEDPAGRTIGYRDSMAFNNLTEGLAIIPKVGVLSPPIGYYLPTGSYRAVLSEFSDSLASFSVFTDTLIYRYSRSDAAFPEQDLLQIAGGIGIKNPDAGAKTVAVSAIASVGSGERMMRLSRLEALGQDSLHFTVIAESEVSLANIGAPKRYDLQLSQADSSGEVIFRHRGIDLPANAGHRLVPLWEDLNQPATLFIDLGNDGTI